MSNQNPTITPTITPTVKQDLAWQELLNKSTRFIVFGGAAGSGKSWLGCEWLLMNCYVHPGSKWFIAREELKRLMSSTFITWSKVCSFHQIPPSNWHLDGKYNVIKFENGSSIDLLDVAFQPSDPLYERFGSLEYTGGWIEEAGEVNFKAFDILKTRVGRQKNKEFNLLPKILLTCNPNQGWLYQLVWKPWNQKKLPFEYSFIPALYSDNPYTAKEYGEQLDLITDPITFQRLKLGKWEYDGDASELVNYDAILDLWTNTVDEQEKYIVADIARMGSDKIRITLWNGRKLVKLFTYEKQDTLTTANQIKVLARDERVPYSHILVDEDGVGGGVLDQLIGARGFLGGSTPFEMDVVNDYGVKEKKPANFQNLKAQCSYKLAEMINGHNLAIAVETDKELLIEELRQIKKRDNDKDGKLKIVPKEEVKETIRRSPDYADCLVMRMWFEFSSAPKQQTVAQVFYPRR